MQCIKFKEGILKQLTLKIKYPKVEQLKSYTQNQENTLQCFSQNISPDNHLTAWAIVSETVECSLVAVTFVPLVGVDQSKASEDDLESNGYGSDISAVMILV